MAEARGSMSSSNAGEEFTAASYNNGDINGVGAPGYPASSLGGGGVGAGSIQLQRERPLILITDSNSSLHLARTQGDSGYSNQQQQQQQQFTTTCDNRQRAGTGEPGARGEGEGEHEETEGGEQVEVIDGIKYRILAAVTKKPPAASEASGGLDGLQSGRHQSGVIIEHDAEEGDFESHDEERREVTGASKLADSSKLSRSSNINRKFSSMRRKSSAIVSSLVSSLQATANHQVVSSNGSADKRPARRLSIYEMTKSPPPETSLEIYLSERRRSSTVSSKHVQQQLAEQQSTFETNYCQRQQYFKDLNQKLINHDKKLLNVVANRGQIHRHSVDIAQLPLHLAKAQAKAQQAAALPSSGSNSHSQSQSNQQHSHHEQDDVDDAQEHIATSKATHERQQHDLASSSSQQLANNNNSNCNNNWRAIDQSKSAQFSEDASQLTSSCLLAIREDVPFSQMAGSLSHPDKRGSTSSRGDRHSRKSRIVIRKFQKLDQFQLSSTPAPDVKIGQRVAYKEYYGSEFGTIRWIGRVPQICPDWTAGVEFDNAIGEGDGSLNGRRYFIAKDCFAKFLPLNVLAFVDQHVGRPEPGTMISVMSATVRPGQMISIQRVSTVHVQHCFLNAPHQIPGADILAVNTRLHCQCPNCGPCAHVIKPPRTQRLTRSRKNATHMCQFSTYTCCGMQSQEEATCTYTGNKIATLPNEGLPSSSSFALPPIGNSWIDGVGYLTNLQAQQSKLMPEEYKLGAALEDIIDPQARRIISNRVSTSRRSGGRKTHHNQQQQQQQQSLPQHDFGESTAKILENVSNGGADSFVEGEDRPNIVASNDNTQQLSQVVNQSTYLNNPLPVETNLDPSCVNLDQFTLASQDKITSYSDNESFNWIIYKDDDNNNTNVSHIPNTSSNNSNKQVPKSAKVVYRDSIENRYLFPTDDPIDSTLEADLENLSQARYGHRTANYRLNGSKNIFKSLRSLVSCLSAQSNHSELDRHSESTLRFSEYGQKSNNKSIPVCEHGVKSSSSLSKPPSPPVALSKSAFNTALSKSRNEKEDSPPYIYSAPPVYDDHIRITLTNNKKHQTNITKQQLSSSSDCGFSSASQNSINFLATSKCSPIITYDEECKRNQIYKNFLTQLVNNTTIKEEDLLRLKRAMFEPNFGNCCLHNNQSNNTIHTTTSSTNSYTNTESDQNIMTENFKQTSTNFNHSSDDKRCCEQKQHCQNTSNTNFCNFESVDSIEHCKVADNSIYLQENLDRTIPQEETVKSPLTRSTRDGSSISGSLSSSCNDSLTGTALIGQVQSGFSPAEGKSKVKLKPENNSSVNSSSLPQAFELKLTLSINSEAQKAQLIEGECCTKPSDQLKSTEII